MAHNVFLQVVALDAFAALFLRPRNFVQFLLVHKGARRECSSCCVLLLHAACRKEPLTFRKFTVSHFSRAIRGAQHIEIMLPRTYIVESNVHTKQLQNSDYYLHMYPSVALHGES